MASDEFRRRRLTLGAQLLLGVVGVTIWWLLDTPSPTPTPTNVCTEYTEAGVALYREQLLAIWIPLLALSLAVVIGYGRGALGTRSRWLLAVAAATAYAVAIWWQALAGPETVLVLLVFVVGAVPVVGTLVLAIVAVVEERGGRVPGLIALCLVPPALMFVSVPFAWEMTVFSC